MDVSVMERTAPVRVERRKNFVLRERFAAAQTLLKPLLESSQMHNGTAFYRAMTRLQTVYPDLSGSEIEALVAAVVRSYQNRQG